MRNFEVIGHSSHRKLIERDGNRAVVRLFIDILQPGVLLDSAVEHKLEGRH